MKRRDPGNEVGVEIGSKRWCLGAMKAITVDKPGDSSELKYKEIPIPEPGKNEVRHQAFAFN